MNKIYLLCVVSTFMWGYDNPYEVKMLPMDSKKVKVNINGMSKHLNDFKFDQKVFKVGELEDINIKNLGKEKLKEDSTLSYFGKFISEYEKNVREYKKNERIAIKRERMEAGIKKMEEDVSDIERLLDEKGEVVTNIEMNNKGEIKKMLLELEFVLNDIEKEERILKEKIRLFNVNIGEVDASLRDMKLKLGEIKSKNISLDIGYDDKRHMNEEGFDYQRELRSYK